MTEPQIRFDDGAGYERMMGVWSRLAGSVFLDWVAPPAGARWLDVGCGNGAFTELIADRCTPTAIEAIDPSEGQLAFARARRGVDRATFRVGDAMSLDYPADGFDAAVMALVIFFVPDPATAVAEMVRVVAPGGSVSAYAWDIVGGGFPLEALQDEMRGVGLNPLRPPSYEASRLDALRQLWTDAGLEGVETRTITVERTFENFDDFWQSSTIGTSNRTILKSAPAEVIAMLTSRLQARLIAGADGRITLPARANAVKGRVRR